MIERQTALGVAYRIARSKWRTHLALDSSLFLNPLLLKGRIQAPESFGIWSTGGSRYCDRRKTHREDRARKLCVLILDGKLNHLRLADEYGTEGQSQST